MLTYFLSTIAGLDASSRSLLVSLLEKLHTSRSPRVLLVLRPQDTLPSFISHIALVDSISSTSTSQSNLKLGTRSEILGTKEAQEMLKQGENERKALQERKERQKARSGNREAEKEGKALIELRNVNIVYGRKGETEERPVLRDVSWTVREGEKWVLAGHNGKY